MMRHLTCYFSSKACSPPASIDEVRISKEWPFPGWGILSTQQGAIHLVDSGVSRKRAYAPTALTQPLSFKVALLG
jgi:hypothetical protein